MGVPSFYRWLVGKYPKVVVNAVEEEADCVDSSTPNPNGFEFDNLYLDMNGIIHPCFHPEDQLDVPTTFDQVFAAIFEYIDRIFKIVRPRKLLYMAIDGVAPRAKMNQQRARRYRTAKDAEIAEAVEERLRKEFERDGKEVVLKQEYEVSDSNVITPGTIFMDKLAKALEYYIRSRLNYDPGWKSIKVILSDANVPGEGEHKIMSFIRLQRSLPGYNPETRHCIYGLDADLIMLALATHEIHFSILREDVATNKSHENVMASVEVFSEQELNLIKSRKWFPKVLSANSNIPKKPYKFLNIWTLREYLELDMKIVDEPNIDFERIVDDFIFISFLTGSDFIPHLPSLEIHEGAIDLLIAVYKNNFKSFGGYLVDTSRIREKKAAYIKINCVERYIREVGFYEDKIFQKRYNLQQRKMQRILNEKKEEESADDSIRMQLDDISHEDSDCRILQKCLDTQLRMDKNGYRSSDVATGTRLGGNKISTSESLNAEPIERSDVRQNTKELKQKLKDYLRSNADLLKNGVLENDKVKLGCEGWKKRYYREKFCAENPTDMEIMRKKIVEKYMEGLCWVLHYYFGGVKSWSWFYSYYYGPFASDFRGLSCPQTEFKIGKPFEPFTQLMAVLPPRSCNALPKAYRKLITGEDSALIEFYPQDLVVDTDGKRFTWQGVCKLPFIDEEKLLSATRMLEKDLEIDEVKRNSLKQNKIFVRKQHALGSKIASIPNKFNGAKYPLDAPSDEINGFLSLCNDSTSSCDLTSIRGMIDIIEDHTLSAIFDNPNYHDHIARLLLTPPETTITEADIVERKLWHEHYGSHPPTTCQQRYTQKPENSNKTGPPNAREIWMGAGSGWSGTGRGNVSAESSHSNHHYYGRNTNRGRGHAEANRFDFWPSDQSNNGRGGNGFRSGLQRGHGGYQISVTGAVTDRSENWRQRSTMVDGGRGRGYSGAYRFASNGGDGKSRW